MSHLWNAYEQLPVYGIYLSDCYRITKTFYNIFSDIKFHEYSNSLQTEKYKPEKIILWK